MELLHWPGQLSELSADAFIDWLRLLTPARYRNSVQRYAANPAVEKADFVARRGATDEIAFPYPCMQGGAKVDGALHSI